MRRPLTGALLAIGVSGLLAVALPAAGLLPQANPLLEELSVRESEAQDGFFNGIWEGSAYVPGGQRVFRAAAPARKAAIVGGIGAMLKAYTRTAAFRTRYAEYWDANRPQPPAAPKSSADRDKETDESIAKMEESIKSMAPEMRKQMEEMVKQVKAQQAAMRNDTQMQQMIESASNQQEQDARQRHQAAVRKYETDHPKNPDDLIANRLREFLALSATVDYEARLVKSGGLMRFERAEFEAKPAEWKLCFRAGKDAADAARAFASEWLKELGAK